jgi:RHS repeat-associated protein
LGRIQNLTYNFDGLGNLTQRVGTGGTENLTYDNLNRLTNSSKQGATTYHANGNINTKRDVLGNTSSAYGYASAKPHAVESAWGYSMTYDGNGNLLTRTKTGETWSLNWAGFDKPRWMAKTTGSVTAGSEFHYNAKRSRVIQLEFDTMSAGAPSHYTRKRIYGMGSTLEANYKNTATSGAPDWELDVVRIYVSGPEGTIGTREFSPSKPAADREKVYIYHHDHLGSIDAITPYGSTANVVATDAGGKDGRFGEDAWGQRRNPITWTGAPSTTDDGGFDSLTPRGFTGHEMLDDLGLVHMNGRIYDPLLGRMLSADTFVQDAGDLQAYNRYSYVRNNPTSLNDPSGHFWSALVTVGFAAYDTYQFATGKTTGAEYAKNMALNGAALVADVATAGQGGGFAVRATNAGIRAAKAVDRADTILNTVEASASVVTDVVNGEVSLNTVANAASAVAGSKGVKSAAPNTSKLDANDIKAAAGDKVSTLPANKQAGKNWEDKVTAEPPPGHTAAKQVTLEVETPDGTVRTRPDQIIRSEAGEFSIVEAKGSASAPLTDAQGKAFPVLGAGGTATVRGDNGQEIGLESGTEISFKEVIVARPNGTQIIRQ